MVTGHRRASAVLAALVVLVLLAAGCSNAKSDGGGGAPNVKAPTDGGEKNRTVHNKISGVPGVTDKTISFAIVGTKQGNPLGTCLLDCYTAGIKAYFAYRNSQGGIYGRTLEVGNVADDQLGNGRTEALKITSSKSLFGSFQAGLLQTGWEPLAKAGVPTYTWGISGADAANRNDIFPSTVIRCSDCTRRLLPYAAKAAGAHSAGVLGYSTSANSQDCADSVAASFKKYAKNTGVTLGFSKDNLPYGLSNGIGPEVSEMKKNHVDFIATCFDLNAMKVLAQELKRQGMSNVVLYHPNTYNQQFVKDADGLFDNNLVEVQFRPFEDEDGNPALKAFKTWMGKAHEGLSELAMVGWLNASLAYDGLLAAGPNFNRAKVVAATNNLHAWTAGGLLPAIDWATAHTPYTEATRGKVKDDECGTYVKVVKGVFTDATTAGKPWLCWNSQDTTWTEPTSKNFN